ncbi:MAG TPA: hypothetical protein VFA65_24470 [Bryobacteraceae bacterium]|nr:hypothetical protein [Bryobacteraceae bacterium]
MAEPTKLKVRGDYSDLIIKKEIDGEIVEYVGIDEMNDEQIEKYCRDTGTKREDFPRMNVTFRSR